MISIDTIIGHKFFILNFGQRGGGHLPFLYAIIVVYTLKCVYIQNFKVFEIPIKFSLKNRILMKKITFQYD